MGLKLEGETKVDGPLVGNLIGLKDVRATLAMLRTPDGQGIELDKFHTPDAVRFGPVNAPVNTLGIRRVMFAVDDIDGVLERMRAHGAEVIGEMQYGETYRLAYLRGPEGIIVQSWDGVSREWTSFCCPTWGAASTRNCLKDSASSTKRATLGTCANGSKAS